MLTTFPTEQATQRKVRARILRHTMSAGAMVEAGQVLDLDHSEFLLLKAAGAAEIAVETLKARPANDDDYAFLRVKGYRPESVEDTQRFLDNFAKQKSLGSYLAAVGAWVKDGRPGIDKLDPADPAPAAAQVATAADDSSASAPSMVAADPVVVDPVAVDPVAANSRKKVAQK